MLYKNLIDIGLKNYLNTYFFNKEWFEEIYLKKLDAFVAKKSKNQKDIIRSKFKSLTDHAIINDHLYELMIAIAYHPTGEFQDNPSSEFSPDLIDNGVNIEVKNINAEPSEIERIKLIDPDGVSNGPFPDDANFEARFRKKFSLRVDKAKQQISNKGKVYIVWDTSLKGSTERIPRIEKLLKDLCEQEKHLSPDVEIVTLDFEKLRELIAK